jgi:hypothetical protein
MNFPYKNQIRINLVFFGCIVYFASFPTLRAQDAAGNDARRTREFVVMGYGGIVSELRSGEGPYMRTLLELLKRNADQRTQTIDQIKSLSKAHSNIMDFADEVVKLQLDGPARDVDVAIPVPMGPTIYSGDRLENALNHLTRGMPITIFTKGGGRASGQFEEYAAHRLWIKGTAHQSFLLSDIVAVDAPRL